jgi:asparagine synthase (glutamine-hydrolysing)
MCGITGEVSFDGSLVDPDRARESCDRMDHRGPDERGYHDSPGAVLGLCRLKVVGLDGGAQPTYNADRTVAAVCNGEIYNYRELRSRLERAGHRVGGTSDAHVIPVLYELLGDDFVHELHGMFAIAIHDSRRRQLVLATDRVGKKPIFYAQRADGTVAFASELAALLAHPGIDRTIDPVAVDQYLSYRVVPAPRTIYQHVRKVPPATLLTFRGGGPPESRRWWRFDFSRTEEGPGPSREVLVDQIADRLETAVADRLVAEVPLGSMLSGGLDSSLVVAIAMQQLGRRMHTFSIGFAQAAFDESAHARAVADHLGTEHHHYEIGPDDARATIDPILAHMGEPYAFPSAIASYHMYRLARQHVTVALTGDGSDEIFAGYNRYKLFERFPDVDPAQRHRVDVEVLLEAGDDEAARYQAVLVDGVRQGLRRQLYHPAFVDGLPCGFPANHLEARFRGTRGSQLDRLLEVDCGFWLPDAQLVKIDRMAMAHSVEPRSPMLDHRLIELVMGIDPAHKLVDGDEKSILKDVALRYLPEATVRRRKQELAVPLEDWLGQQLRPHIQATLLSEASLSRGYFQPDALRAFAIEFSPAHTYALWTLFMLERWHQLADEPSLAAEAAAMASSDGELEAARP